jgi:multidrug resistance efflux pump
MRGKKLMAAGTLVLAAAAAGALFSLRRSAVPAASPKPAAPPRQLAGDLILPARIRARNVTSVPVPVQGTMESLAVDAGQQVYEGQLLGRIGNASLDAEQQSATAALERAQARLGDLEAKLIVSRAEASRARSDATRLQAEFDRAERARARQQMLVKEGATPRLVYEKSVKEYDAAKLERDTAADLARGAEDRLSVLVKTTDAARQSVDAGTEALDRAKAASAAAEIRSPVTGLVVARTKQAGEEVTPDVQDLFQIASDLSALEAVIEPQGADLARIRPGQEVLITLADAPDAIASQVAAINGSEVVVRFTSPNPAIRPGITAQVRIRM